MKIIKQTTNQELEKIIQIVERHKAKNEFPELVFDTESTGLDTKTVRMHEIGFIVRVNGKPLLDDDGKDISNVQIYFDPWLEDQKLYQTKEAYAVHGIDSDFVKGKNTLGGAGQLQLETPAGPIKNYLENLRILLSENTLVSHNGKVYDIPLLNAELKRAGMKDLGKANTNIDTLFIFRQDIKADELKEMGLTNSRKLSLDNNDKEEEDDDKKPRGGLVAYLEIMNGTKCEVNRELHGALEDSLMLEWVVAEMLVCVGKDGKPKFPSLIEQYSFIQQANEEAKAEETEKERVFEEVTEESNVVTYFRTNQSIPFHNDAHKQGSVDTKQMIEDAEKLGLKEITIMDFQKSTEHRILFEKAKGSGLKINYGATLAVKLSTGHLVEMNFVANSDIGYNNLMSLMTQSSFNDNNTPQLTEEELFSMSKGLTVTTGQHSSMIHSSPSLAKKFNDNIDDFRIEIENEAALNKYNLNMEANDYLKGIPVVYTHLANFNNPKDSEIHLSRVASSLDIDGAVYQTEIDKEAYLKNPQELNKKFNGVGIDSDNTLGNDFEFPEFRDIMADYIPTREDGDIYAEFVETSKEGLAKRLLNDGIPEAQHKEYFDRLDSEMGIIKDMIISSSESYEKGESLDKIQFDAYLLGVMDYIKMAKSVKDYGILVGTARGSAAGSLVAYSLEITEIDPIKYGLIFERFINPSRVNMPDVDTDFAGKMLVEDLNNEQTNKDYPGLYELVKQKMGKIEYIEAKDLMIKYRMWYFDTLKGTRPEPEMSHVASVQTKGEYKPKSAIASACKNLGSNYAKALGFKDNVQLSDFLKKFIKRDEWDLDEALQESDELRALYEGKPLIRRLIKEAKRLEGTIRSNGSHAAAVVVKPENPEGVITTSFQYDKNGKLVSDQTMKTITLVKYDDLGLKNLELIENTLQSVKKRTGEKKIDLSKIPREFEGNENLFKLIQEGKNAGLFQIESEGMIELCLQLKPENFEELSALIALYRPGPMESGMLDSYVKRKQGKEDISYTFPIMEDILKNTYGVMVYQEQIMQIVSAVGGFSQGEADSVRRAMGKKDVKLLTSYKAQFVEGAVAQNLNAEEADKLFEEIIAFAGYGFNKSHSIAYADIAFQTAYLKANFPMDFAASRLNYKIDGKAEDMAKVILSIEKEGLEVLPPNLDNFSREFAASDKGIIYSYEFIVGERSAKKMEAGLTDNMSREDKITWIMNNLDKSAVEKLIKSGDLKLNGETQAEVNEKYYAIRAGKSQYKIVLEKIKTAVSSGKAIAYGNIFKISDNVWNRETLEMLLIDPEIKNLLSAKELEKMNKKVAEMIKENKIKFFPETDFEIWSSEMDMLGMAYSVDHPLLSKNVQERYHGKQKATGLSKFLKDFEEEADEQKEKKYNNKNLKTIGIVGKVFETQTKKGQPMIIADLITENNEEVTTMAMGDNLEAIKESMLSNTVVEISGKTIYSEEKGMAIFIETADIIGMTEDEVKNVKKETEISTYKVQEKSGKPVLMFPKVNSQIKFIADENGLKVYGNVIYPSAKFSIDKMIEIYEAAGLVEDSKKPKTETNKTDKGNGSIKDISKYKAPKILDFYIPEPEKKVKKTKKATNNSPVPLEQILVEATNASAEVMAEVLTNENGKFYIDKNLTQRLIDQDFITVNGSKVVANGKEMRGVSFNSGFLNISGFGQQAMADKLKYKFEDMISELKFEEEKEVKAEIPISKTGYEPNQKITSGIFTVVNASEATHNGSVYATLTIDDGKQLMNAIISPNEWSLLSDKDKEKITTSKIKLEIELALYKENETGKGRLVLNKFITLPKEKEKDFSSLPEVRNIDIYNLAKENDLSLFRKEEFKTANTLIISDYMPQSIVDNADLPKGQSKAKDWFDNLTKELSKDASKTFKPLLITMFDMGMKDLRESGQLTAKNVEDKKTKFANFIKEAKKLGIKSFILPKHTLKGLNISSILDKSDTGLSITDKGDYIMLSDDADISKSVSELLLGINDGTIPPTGPSGTQKGQGIKK